MADGLAASSFTRTVSEARATRVSSMCGGISGRSPRQAASPSSFSERCTSMAKPRPENRAPLLPTAPITTSRSPRLTSTVVTTSLSVGRRVIASRWPCPFCDASSTSVSSSSRGDCDSTGPATSMASLNASARIVFGGELAIGASRVASSICADCSILAASRPITSSNSATSSSENRAEPSTNRSVIRCRICERRSDEPLAMACSSSLMKLRSAPILTYKPPGSANAAGALSASVTYFRTGKFGVADW